MTTLAEDEKTRNMLEVQFLLALQTVGNPQQEAKENAYRFSFNYAELWWVRQLALQGKITQQDFLAYVEALEHTIGKVRAQFLLFAVGYTTS